MGFSDFVRKTLEKERGYRYAGRYSTEHTGSKVKLYHYGTEIIRYDIDKQKIELGQGWSASDRDAVNRFIYEAAQHFGLDETPQCSRDSGSSWYREKRQRHRIDAVQHNRHRVLWRVKNLLMQCSDSLC